MDAVVWSSRFETGIASVDDQHRQLVEIINRAGQMLVDTACASETALLAGPAGGKP